MTETAPSRRPWLAALLNVLSPGLGHLYAGDAKGAALWFLTPFVSLTLSAVVVLGLPATIFSVLLFWGIPLTCYILLGTSGWSAARRAVVPFLPKPLNRWYWYLGFAALSGSLYGVFVRPYFRDHLLQTYEIPGESMAPTLAAGDFIIVDRRPIAPGDLHPGDLVVFESVEEPGLQVIKRVMGVAGDTLQMWSGALIRSWTRQQDDPFYDPSAAQPMDSATLVNALRWQIPAFARPVPAGYTPDPSNWGPLMVPPGHFFAIGDNRNRSWDSRFYGFVPDSNLLGRPKLIYWNSLYLTPGMLARVGTGPK